MKLSYLNMKNKFKYKAWDIKREKFVDILLFHYTHEDDKPTFMTGCHNGKTDELYFPKDYILFQFTGLTDKNGTEIYEGDIVSTPKDSIYEGKNREFIFANGCFGFRGFITTCVQQRQYECDKFEVVGNVKKNPELTK